MRILLKFMPVLLLIVINCTSPKQKEQVVKSAITPDTAFKKPEPVADLQMQRIKKEAVQPEVTINSIYKKLSEPPQVFKVTNTEDTVIVCKEGTKLTIPSNCFVTKSGKEVTGDVQLKTEEFYSKSDILLAGLTTLSDGKLLESGGMINLQAFAGGEEVQLKEGKSIRIEMPAKEKEEGMQLFNGVKGKDGKVNWVVAEEETISEVEMPLSIMINGYRQVIYRKIKIEDKNKKVLLNDIYEDDEAAQKRKEEVCSLYTVSFNIYSNGRIQLLKFALQGKPVNDAISFIQQKPGAGNEVFSETNKLDFTKDLVMTLDSSFKKSKKLGAIALRVTQLDWLKKKNKSFPYKVDINVELRKTEYTAAAIEFQESLDGRGQGDFGGQDGGDTYYSTSSCYVFTALKMGYINCDRFYYDRKPKVNVQVNGGRDADVRMVFKNINSYMSPSNYRSSSVSIFNNVPSDKKIIVVAVKVVHKETYLAIRESNTSEEQITLSYEKVTLAELKERMKKLNAM